MPTATTPCLNTCIDAFSVTFLYLVCFLGYCATVLCIPFVGAYKLFTHVFCCRRRTADCDRDIEQYSRRSQDAVSKDLDPQRSPGMAQILDDLEAAELRRGVSSTPARVEVW